MNILLLSNCPVVEHEGSGYVILSTARAFSDAGYAVDIVKPSSLLLGRNFHGKGQIYRLAVGMAKWVIFRKKQLQQYSLIIFYGAESSLAIYILKVVLNIKVPVVLHSNGLELHVDARMEYFKKYIKEEDIKWYHHKKMFLFRYCYKNSDALITVSEDDRNFAVSKIGISPERVYYNEPSIPDIFFENKSRIEKRDIITYCGSWIPRKGIESIKGSIPEILRKYPSYKFRLIGQGHDFNPADHFPFDILNKIEVVPIVKSKEALFRLYSESSIFVFPSFCESFGLVVAEAMFCRCAVITGPTGLAASIKNNHEAVVVKIPDASAVFKALEHLINDPLFRKKLGDGGRARTEQLTSEKYSQKLIDIVEDILKSHSSLKVPVGAS